VQNKNKGVGQITITICGSLNYIAPEMVKCAPYNKKVDNWAVGVLLFEFLVECLTGLPDPGKGPRPLRPKLTATWRPFTATLIDTSVGPFLTVKKI